ncbi:hypothetical protein QYZ88_013870 [Lachnospiraceae bacterium C1.1]|nr:hypothetical protein [Lachnospiraceae bacterium C1.1]
MGNDNRDKDVERLSENPVEYLLDTLIEMVKQFSEGMKKGMGIPTADNEKDDPMKQMQAMMQNMMQMFQGMQNMQMQAMKLSQQPVNPQMPNKQMSNMQMPNMQMPNMQMPNMQMPNMQMPNMQMPNMQIPTMQMPAMQMSDMNNMQNMIMNFAMQSAQYMMAGMMQSMQMQLQRQMQMPNMQMSNTQPEIKPEIQPEQPNKVQSEKEQPDDLIKNQQELQDANRAYKEAKAENDELVQRAGKQVETFVRASDEMDRYNDAIGDIKAQKDKNIENDERELNKEIAEAGLTGKLDSERDIITRSAYRMDARQNNKESNDFAVKDIRWFSRDELAVAVGNLEDMKKDNKGLDPAAEKFRTALIGLYEKTIDGGDGFNAAENIKVYNAAEDFLKEVRSKEEQNPQQERNPHTAAAAQAATEFRRRLDENGRIEKLKYIEPYKRLSEKQAKIEARKYAQNNRDKEVEQLKEKIKNAKDELKGIDPAKAREDKAKLDAAAKKLAEAKRRRDEALSRTREAQQRVSKPNNPVRKARGRGM